MEIISAIGANTKFEGYKIIINWYIVLFGMSCLLQIPWYVGQFTDGYHRRYPSTKLHFNLRDDNSLKSNSPSLHSVNRLEWNKGLLQHNDGFPDIGVPHNKDKIVMRSPYLN